MRRSKFTEDQIAFALKQNELGTSVDEVCRKMGISDPTHLAPYVRLLGGRGIAKDFEFIAGGINCGDARPVRHMYIEPEPAGAPDLGYQVHIGQRRRVAVGEFATRGMDSKQAGGRARSIENGGW